MSSVTQNRHDCRSNHTLPAQILFATVHDWTTHCADTKVRESWEKQNWPLKFLMNLPQGIGEALDMRLPFAQG